ncbi:MAG TPA: hypothetical protein VJM81_02450 [Rhizorhapis sp.]|nr:hypothetical protein [Rhizorhapis sp.]
MTEEEHEEAIIVPAFFADLAFLAENGNSHAIERTLHGDVFEHLHPEIQRGGPGFAETFRAGGKPQLIGAHGRHVHGLCRMIHRSCARERLYEAALPLGRPTVMAVVLARYGGEIGDGVAWWPRGVRFLMIR